MGNKFVQNSLNAGELSPKLDARTDIAKYYNGTTIMSNALAKQQGGAIKRPGGKWIAKAKGACNLLPFSFSADDSMVLEAGNGYMRFFKNSERVMADPVTIVGVTLEEEVVVPGAYTYIWHEVQPAGDVGYEWLVASDSDGSNLIAAQGHGSVGSGQGYLFTSSDSGVTWVNRYAYGLPKRKWVSVDSDSDGSHLIACGFDSDYTNATSHVYTSNNSGASWTQVLTATRAQNRYLSVASDADGSNLIVGKEVFSYVTPSTCPIYTSSNYGSSWTERLPTADIGNNYWGGVDSDSDGSHLVGNIKDKIYTSSDYGATWTERFPTGSDPGYDSTVGWTGEKYNIRNSSDGSVIIASVDGYVYASDDGGATWTMVVYSNSFWKLGLGSDGSNFIAGNDANFPLNKVYYSLDIGVEHVITYPTGESYEYVWKSAASSSDGDRLIMGGESQGRVYIGVKTAV